MDNLREKRPGKRPPLRETVMQMDKDLLRMFARRSNILDKMKGRNAYLDPREEKELRASWEKHATQMSRDPRLIHQLFVLLQELEFSSKPEEGAEKRLAYNLAPQKLPVDVLLTAPVSCRRSRLYLALAAASGSALRIYPSLLGDATIECIKMFNQCATSLAWDDDGTLRARQGGGLSLPDKVIHVGDNALNFYLLLAHYIGKPTKAKFLGETHLKSSNFSSLRRFLPQLGARLSNALPNSTGLPVRIECSGVLPDSVTIPADIDRDAVLALLMAAPFYDAPITFDLSTHSHASAIIEEALSVLLPCGAKIQQHGYILRCIPSPIETPKEPDLGMDLSLAAYILALPIAVQGKVRLNGLWPACPEAQALEAFYTACGVNVHREEHAITVSAQEHAQGETQDIDSETIAEKLDVSQLDARFAPLAMAMALLSALRGKKTPMPALSTDTAMEEVELFLSHFSLMAGDDGILCPAPKFDRYAPRVRNTEALAESDAITPTVQEELIAVEVNEEPITSAAQEELTESTPKMTLQQSIQENDNAPINGFVLHHAMKNPSKSVQEQVAAFQSSSIAETSPTKYSGLHPKASMEKPMAPQQDFHEANSSETSAVSAPMGPQDDSTVWTAPSPAWAMAYALCAFEHKNLKLANPGIMTDLYPKFWNMYNALPCPHQKKPVTEPQHEKPVRRRIIAADQDGAGDGDTNN